MPKNISHMLLKITKYSIFIDKNISFCHMQDFCNEQVYTNCSNAKNNHVPFRNKFTVDEDNLLKFLVEEKKITRWCEVSKFLPGRTTKQCRDRYSNYLSPSITNLPWTQEEDQLLREKVDEFGKKWVYISQFFDGRSGNNLKNRWHKVLCKDEKNDSTFNQNSTLKNEKKVIRIAKLEVIKPIEDNSAICQVKENFNETAFLLEEDFSSLLEDSADILFDF